MGFGRIPGMRSINDTGLPASNGEQHSAVSRGYARAHQAAGVGVKMSSEDWVVTTNLLVAVTSILAALAAEHDAVRAMRDTVLGVISALKGNPPPEPSKDNQET